MRVLRWSNYADARVLEHGDVDYARAQAGRLHWKDTNEAELAPQHKAIPLDDPEEGDDWVLHAKDDAAGDDIERCIARLAIQGAGGTGDSSLGHAAPRYTSIQVNNNFEIGQIETTATYMKGILTSNEAFPMNEPPRYSIPAGFVGICFLIPSPIHIMHRIEGRYEIPAFSMPSLSCHNHPLSSC